MHEGRIQYVDGLRGITETGVPHTVDLRITGQCQLRCDWCWGPEHFRKGSITPDQWKETIGRLAMAGTQQIVFSGGEPLVSRSLRPGVEAAKQNGLSITLSTNGILLARNKDLLRSIDDLGIPIDGSNIEINNIMRRWSAQRAAWQKAVDAVRITQEMNRAKEVNVKITTRTVIAKPNLRDIPKIPAALESEGVDLGDLRMKFYQVEPLGPHFSHIDFEGGWAVTADEAEEVVSLVQEARPGMDITLQLYEGTVGRYFLVDPDGYATGTDENESYDPVEVDYGNVVHDFDATLCNYLEHQALCKQLHNQ